MATEVGIRELLEAGVHFGHQTRRWNPKMRRFIFGERGGIHIIDLQKTERLLKQAQDFAANSPRAAAPSSSSAPRSRPATPIKEAASAAGMPYIDQRWLGGLLTNFQTISKRIKRLHDLTRLDRERHDRPAADARAHRADVRARQARDNLGGVRNMQRPPDAIFIVDLKTEEIGVREAHPPQIPIIGLVDTNCDPDPWTT